jgi:hypothetical protein
MRGDFPFYTGTGSHGVEGRTAPTRVRGSFDGLTQIFTGAHLVGCRVYGFSAWDLNLDGAKQKDLIITPHDEPETTVDNLEVAQFIYLLLHNEKIRDVIDTITTKAVLILGRFTPEREAVLDALREELRRRDRTPIVFDFDRPESKNITDTVKLLAQLARYVIVDLSDPNSAPSELGVISMLGLDSTPMVPLIAGGAAPIPDAARRTPEAVVDPARHVPGPRRPQGEPRRDAHQDR